MKYHDIQVSFDAAVGVVSLQRPDCNNALRPQTLREVCAGLDDLTGNAEVRAIVLRGEGKHFCAGADFEFLDQLTQTAPADIQKDIYEHFQGAARRLYNCPKPTVALIGGAAVTVGCELALACDFRLVASDARLQESWIKLGLMPPLGGLFLLPRIVGLGRAAQIVLRGEAVDAAAAVAMGLATEVVSRDQLDRRGGELAAELARLPPGAYAATKHGLHRGMESTMQNEWQANVLAQSLLLTTQDFREGLAAVKERRAGKFSGR